MNSQTASRVIHFKPQHPRETGKVTYYNENCCAAALFKIFTITDSNEHKIHKKWRWISLTIPALKKYTSAKNR